MLSVIYYIKLKSRLSICLSDRHADISAMSAVIEMGLAWNESWVFRDLKVYFYKSKRISIHPYEDVKANGVN